uniref:Zinc finger and BTB domain containing 39 n=1 Tax=Salarias fasciatus TaxID=181472 RepID=A0A672I897_SALFA
MRVRLRGRGHAASLLLQLNLCRQSRRYCDVVLRAGGRTFAAHRAVLACAGEYFRNLFAGAPASPGAELLTFVYTGEVVTDLTDVGLLHELAERLGVAELVRACRATFPDLPAAGGALDSGPAAGGALDSSTVAATSDLQALVGFGQLMDGTAGGPACPADGEPPAGPGDGEPPAGAALQLKTEPGLEIGQECPADSLSLHDASYSGEPAGGPWTAAAPAAEVTGGGPAFGEEPLRQEEEPWRRLAAETIELSDDDNFLEEGEDDPVCLENGGGQVARTGTAAVLGLTLVLPLQVPTWRRRACAACAGRRSRTGPPPAPHCLAHVGVPLFSCDMCQLQFCSRGQLLRHHRRAAAASPGHQGCFWSLSHRVWSLCPPGCSDHVLSHVGEGLRCPLCQQAAPSRCRLLWHALEHLALPVFCCPRCARCFARRPLLERHAAAHAQERPAPRDSPGGAGGGAKRKADGAPSPSRGRWYGCRHCGKRFAHSGEFTYHLRIHSGQKPFQCRLCLRCFRGRSTIICHLKTHAGALMYRCTVCGRYFSTLKAVSAHMELHRGRLPPDFHIQHTFMYNDRSKEPLPAP